METVVFVRTHTSSRSQMAEGLLPDGLLYGIDAALPTNEPC